MNHKYFHQKSIGRLWDSSRFHILQETKMDIWVRLCWRCKTSWREHQSSDMAQPFMWSWWMCWCQLRTLKSLIFLSCSSYLLI